MQIKLTLKTCVRHLKEGEPGYSRVFLMPCFYPIAVYSFKGENGKQVINFNIPRGKTANLMLPCNKCFGCRLEYSRQWAVRCMHEAKYHDDNCFLTLTYDDENLPYGGTLVKRDLQLFNKRLRKKVGRYRFYAGGEYGDLGERPHYHMCMFGYRPNDSIQLSKKGLFTSPLVSQVWGKGFVSFGDLTFESAAYVARYCLKKIGATNKEDWQRLDDETGEIFQLEPPFPLMSRGTGREADKDTVWHRGIGSHFAQSYTSDIYPSDNIIGSGRVLGKPPRYYDKILEQTNEQLYEKVKESRKQKLNDIDVEEQMDMRMRAKEACIKAKLNQRKRKL